MATGFNMATGVFSIFNMATPSDHELCVGNCVSLMEPACDKVKILMDIAQHFGIETSLLSALENGDGGPPAKRARASSASSGVGSASHVADFRSANDTIPNGTIIQMKAGGARFKILGFDSVDNGYHLARETEQGTFEEISGAYPRLWKKWVLEGVSPQQQQQQSSQPTKTTKTTKTTKPPAPQQPRAPPKAQPPPKAQQPQQQQEASDVIPNGTIIRMKAGGARFKIRGFDAVEKAYQLAREIELGTFEAISGFYPCKKWVLDSV